jgi:hypothetical protein
MKKNKISFDKAYAKTIGLLEDLKATYLIIGGLAVGILGEARMTQDVDILIKLGSGDIPTLLKSAASKGFGFNRKRVLETIELQGFFRLELGNFHVDFVIGSMPFEIEAFKRRRKIKLYNKTAAFPTPEDLILFKIIPGREKDLLDAKTIVMRHKDKLDISYLKKWARVISDDLQNMRIYKRLEDILAIGRKNRNE